TSHHLDLMSVLETRSQRPESPCLRRSASPAAGGVVASGADGANALRNGVVDRQSVKHASIVTDDACIHHLNQRFAELLGGYQADPFLLLDHAEKLKVARRASAREGAGGGGIRHHANKDRCEHP